VTTGRKKSRKEKKKKRGKSPLTTKKTRASRRLDLQDGKSGQIGTKKGGEYWGQKKWVKRALKNANN